MRFLQRIGATFVVALVGLLASVTVAHAAPGINVISYWTPQTGVVIERYDSASDTFVACSFEECGGLVRVGDMPASIEARVLENQQVVSGNRYYNAPTAYADRSWNGEGSLPLWGPVEVALSNHEMALQYAAIRLYDDRFDTPPMGYNKGIPAGVNKTVTKQSVKDGTVTPQALLSTTASAHSKRAMRSVPNVLMGWDTYNGQDTWVYDEQFDSFVRSGLAGGISLSRFRDGLRLRVDRLPGQKFLDGGQHYYGYYGANDWVYAGTVWNGRDKVFYDANVTFLGESLGVNLVSAWLDYHWRGKPVPSWWHTGTKGGLKTRL